MSGVKEISFGQGDASFTGRAKRFKAEAGSVYRVSFIWFDDGLLDGKLNFGTEAAPLKPKFLGALVHYLEGAGYVINNGPEYTKVAGEPPKARIGTIIVIWPTDKNGKLDKVRLASEDDGVEVVRWIFSSDKYRSLEQIHAEFPLSWHDVTLSCTDSGYQKMTFTPCKESLLNTMAKNTSAASVAKVARLVSEAARITSEVQSDIGQELTLDQLREKLGGAGGAASPMFDDSAATSGNIDGLVGGLLDDD